jgi:thermostable 8-oxoguanine DNA glycosylase
MNEKLYLKNSDQLIKNVTRKAFKIKDLKNQMNLLTTLHGVQYAVGSALLTVVYPDLYGIIDNRAIAFLRDQNIFENTSLSMKKWIEYLKIIRKYGEDLGITPRDVDKGLFGIHKGMGLKLNQKKLDPDKLIREVFIKLGGDESAYLQMYKSLKNIKKELW